MGSSESSGSGNVGTLHLWELEQEYLVPGPHPQSRPHRLRNLPLSLLTNNLWYLGVGSPEALEMAGAWEDTLDWEVTDCSSCFVIFNPNESCPWGH